MIEGTKLTPEWTVRLKHPLGILDVDKLVLGEQGLVLKAYKSPGYISAHRPSWVISIEGKVVEVFAEDVELLTVQRTPLDSMPEDIKRYILPDYRGFTTMPYQVE